MMVGWADRRIGGWQPALRAVLSARPTIRVSALLLLAACQPASRRLLVLDLTLRDPIALEATARPWQEAGYVVEYRRFYPHLTYQDVKRYHTLLLLGGREPEGASDALTVGDLALLSAWVRRGRVVVLAYAGDGEGFLDRWIMNRWLAAAGAGVVIGDYALEDTVDRPVAGFEPQPRASPLGRAPVRDAGFDAFPAGRNHVLLANDQRRVLARTTPTAFVRPGPGQPPAGRGGAPIVAASRVGAGLVVVASRHALAARGGDLRPSTEPLTPAAGSTGTLAFFRALARWTRRPAEWAGVPSVGHADPLVLGDAPQPVSPRPPRLAPPPGVDATTLARGRAEEGATRAPPVPDWIRRQGLRLLWSDATARERTLDALVELLEFGSLNALAGPLPNADILDDSLAHSPAERAVVRAVWGGVVDRLRRTSLRWFPAVAVREVRGPRDTLARGVRGDTLRAPCALDPRFWDGGLGPAYRALARLARQQPDLIAGLALDLDFVARGAAPGYGMGADFCDVTYRAALDGFGPQADSAALAALAVLPVERRYDALLESGLLDDYYEALEGLVADRAAALRSDVRRIAPHVLFALKTSTLPADWFPLGVLRGFAATREPLFLWSREPRAADAVAALRARGIPVVHATGLTPRHVPSGAWVRLRRSAFPDGAGFWLAEVERSSLPADSLGRLIRRLAEGR